MEQPVIRPGQGQREGANRDPRLDWWRDARFGMFIHWGLYAIPAGQWKGQAISGIGEWIMYRARIPVAEYEALAPRFNPVRFDAAEWVSLAKRAGQKYLVITSKHHDGFCMFDSAVTDYTIAKATPFRRDPLKELAAECQRQGIRFGFYYSQTQDWHHPNGDANDWDFDESKKDFAGYIEDYVKPQVRELMTNYGPISVVWFDTPRRIERAQSESLLKLVHDLQPECLVNGRLGNGLGDYGEAGDNRYPDVLLEQDWEVPATINDTWGFKSDDHSWKSPEDLVRKLVDVSSKGGVYLLNVGPTAQGVIPQPSADRLLAVGKWLETNGESVYGTRPGPVQGLDWCRTTRKLGQVYLHVFEWPHGGVMRVPGLLQPVTEAWLLADPARTRLALTARPDGVTIAGPASAPDAMDSVVVLETE